MNIMKRHASGCSITFKPFLNLKNEINNILFCLLFQHAGNKLYKKQYYFSLGVTQVTFDHTAPGHNKKESPDAHGGLEKRDLPD